MEDSQPDDEDRTTHIPSVPERKQRIPGCYQHGHRRLAISCSKGYMVLPGYGWLQGVYEPRGQHRLPREFHIVHTTGISKQADFAGSVRSLSRYFLLSVLAPFIAVLRSFVVLYLLESARPTESFESGMMRLCTLGGMTGWIEAGSSGLGIAVRCSDSSRTSWMDKYRRAMVTVRMYTVVKERIQSCE